jgi:hypothetical protein
MATRCPPPLSTPSRLTRRPIAQVLGAEAGVEAGVDEARAFVRTALSGNSRATLGHAKEYAEGNR